MADRQTKVTLALQMQQYVDGMRAASKATRETASEAQKLTQQREAFTLLGRTAVTAGGVMAAGLAVAVAKFAEFDQAMSNVQAATHETTENMELLRDAALEAGATTVFSATEAANAIEELAKAGIATEDILSGGLTGALDLAAAGGLGVAEAAEIAATTMQQFSLEGDKATHVADILAAGAGKAMGDVTDMAAALNQAGLVANQFGIDVEEAAGGLAAFASQGLLGSDAGTSLRTMLLRLANPTEEVKDLMKAIGFEAYDAAGNFIGLKGVAGELESSLAGMTEEQKQTNLAMIFGQDAIRAATILYEEGAAGIEEWTNKVDDAGYAAETAATRLDNLKGDWEALSGAVDTALISMGEAADGPLRTFIQSLTGLVDMFNEMPEAGQQAVFWIGAVGAAALTAYGSYLLLVPKIVEYNEALGVMGPNAQRAGRALALIGKGVGITAAVATAMTIAADAAVKFAREVRGTDEAVAKATTTNQTFLEAMESLKTTTDATAGGVARALDALASGDVLGPVGTDILVLRDTLTELDKGLEGLPLDDARRKFQTWGDELGLSRAQMGTLLDELPGLRDAIRENLIQTGDAADRQSVLNEALRDAEPPAKTAADAFKAIADEADEAESNLSDMEEALRGVAGAAVEMGAAKDSALSALNDLKDAAEEEGATLDGTNDASIALRDAIREVEESHRDAAQAILENGGTLEDARTEWEKGREAVINQRIAMGESREEAEKWADQNLGSAKEVEKALQGVKTAVEQIPDTQTITITADDGSAREVLRRLVTFANGTSISVPVRGSADWEGPGRADGGAIYGPGGPRDDEAGWYRLSNGEHVLTASDVAAMGGQHNVYAFRESLHGGGSFGGGGGGNVQVDIHPQPGMSEEQIGHAAAKTLEFEMRAV
jgi:TP901 family phage tail tape measure protein